MNALTTARLNAPDTALKKYEVDADQWRALTDAVFPTAKDPAAIFLAISYCRSRNLDIMKKPVHVVGVWDSSKGKVVETVWPSITLHRIEASRTGEYAGIDEIEFGPEETRTFRGSIKAGNSWKDVEITTTFPQWARATVYRMVKGSRVPFSGPKVRWLEYYGRLQSSDVPNQRWQTAPYYQLEKCAEAGALRRAFPDECGDATAEEMEGRHINHDPLTIPPTAEPGQAMKERLDRARNGEDQTIEGKATEEAPKPKEAPKPEPKKPESDPMKDAARAFVADLKMATTVEEVESAHQKLKATEIWKDVDAEQESWASEKVNEYRALIEKKAAKTGPGEVPEDLKNMDIAAIAEFLWQSESIEMINARWELAKEAAAVAAMTEEERDKFHSGTVGDFIAEQQGA